MNKLIITLMLCLLGLGASSAALAQESYSSNLDVQMAEKASDYKEWKSEGTLVNGLSQTRHLIDYRINERLKLSIRPGKKTRVAMKWSF